MELFQIILACVEIICCILLVLSVMFQKGSKQGLGAIGGASDAFAQKGKGNDIDAKLRKVTIIVSIIFVIVCIGLNILTLSIG